jgi:hypothetical protein
MKMVMTKTEFKKRLVALAIEQLENEFGVEFTGDDENRLGFINGYEQDLGVTFQYEQLENEFGVEFDGTDEGRLGFTVAGFNGQFSRGDMSVTLWESIPLSGQLDTS